MLLVEVRGTFLSPNGGADPTGVVEFEPRVTSIQSATEIIVGSTVVGVLDEAGSFTVDLHATDAPGFLPTGWTYKVTERINGRVRRVYDISVPFADQGTGIDLVTVAPVSPANGDTTTWVTLVALNAAVSAEAALRVAGDAAEAASRTAADLLKSPHPGNGFVALGDSISCSSTAATAGGGFGQAWPHMVCVLSQQRLNFLGNGGVSGENSTQILARVPAVIALKPQIVTVLAGTNDLTQGVTFAVWSANIEAIATQLRAAGIRVFLCTLPPRDNTMTASTAVAHIWNRWLRAYAQQNSYELLDFYALLVDGVTGLWAAGMGLDSVHPSAAAHLVMANYVIAQIDPPSFSPIQALAALEADNLCPNPMLSTGSPTPTAWIPGGTGGMTGLTESLQTDADFVGKAWEWALVTPSIGFRSFYCNLISSANFSVGDQILFTCKAKVLTSSGIAAPGNDVGLSFKPFFNGGTPSLIDLVPGHSLVTPVGLYWFRYVVPAGTTSIQTGFIVNNLGTGGTWTARVGQFGVYNLTRLGLVTA